MQLKPLKIGELTAHLPIVQGGMGVGVSLSGLAGAVAAEGGIGVISTAQIGYLEDDWDMHPLEANLRAVKKQIEKARKIAPKGVIGANIMVATRFYERYVKAAVDAGIDIIISGAGLPIDLPKFVGDSKTKIAPIVSSLKSATVICKLWERRFKRIPDMVVIEGPEAGGHLGFQKEELQDISSMSYAEEIKKIIQYVKELGEKYTKKIPVIIAGGIYDKADVEKCLALGADGVQLATRFVTTKECDASQAFKEAYIHARKEDIEIVKSPVGMPGRAIHNPNIAMANRPEKCHQCINGCNPAETPYCITDALIHAVKGDIEQGMVFCGSNAYRAEKIETVKEVMESLQ